MKALCVVLLSAALVAGCAATPSHDGAGQYLDDTSITAKIETELLDGEGIWSSDIIRVETVQGAVHLRGYVTTEHNRQRAGEIARSVAGVEDVENDIRVR